MYIVAIGWLYVALMMAITESSVIGGIGTFVFYGLLPVAIVMYLLGTPARWRAKKRAADAERARFVAEHGASNQEAVDPPSESVSGKASDQPDH
jgi:hypothetical protein